MDWLGCQNLLLYCLNLDFMVSGPLSYQDFRETGPRLRHIVKIVNRYFLIPKSRGGGLGAFETQVDVIIVSVIIYQGAR